ncbi:hypothetical protein EYC84_000921 [Monilinia fructicola]|uniref:Uncharacterized protein n=1 Tax=Monilinia fructicola TaxID=38448 RepID=A0A5M9JID3_MONFR|nr:hypothetical protein EYC84_000921 [Monilinia fructicola]
MVGMKWNYMNWFATGRNVSDNSRTVALHHQTEVNGKELLACRCRSISSPPSPFHMELRYGNQHRHRHRHRKKVKKKSRISFRTKEIFWTRAVTFLLSAQGGGKCKSAAVQAWKSGGFFLPCSFPHRSFCCC